MSKQFKAFSVYTNRQLVEQLERFQDWEIVGIFPQTIRNCNETFNSFSVVLTRESKDVSSNSDQTS